MRFWNPNKATLQVATLISAIGGITALLMIVALRSTGSSIIADQELMVAPAAMLSAFIAGWLISPAYGRAGWLGWVLAFVGSVLATAVGAFIAGLLVYQAASGAMLCVMMLGVILATFPAVGLPWLVMMAGAHYWTRRLFLIAEVPADLDLVPGPNDL